MSLKSFFLSMCGDIAAAVTATETPGTIAAGCDFTPAASQAPRNRRPILYRWSLRDFNGPETARGMVEASDIRGALRAWNREARSRHGHGRPFACGFEGPAYRCEPMEQCGDPSRFVADCLNREGGSVGVLLFSREDGRPIRSNGRKGGAK